MIKYDYYVADFETVVEDDSKNQTETEVWASAIVPLWSEDVKIFGCIEKTVEYLCNLSNNSIIYYHNLKFDGSFFIDYFLRNGWKQGIKSEDQFKKLKELENGEFTYLYSDTGLMYDFTFKYKNKIIKLYDSYKILPFSVKKIGEDFETKHRKTSIEYVGHRYANCPRTQEEDEYIANDVLVIKEAMEIMHQQGYTAMTIGSNAMSYFKDIINEETFPFFPYARNQFDALFPDLYNFDIYPELYGESNAGDYIYKSYNGGWVYLKPEYKEKIIYNGATYDVNSEYPSMMHSSSGNIFPIGFPHFWHGNYIDSKAKRKDRFYFIKFRCKFELKDGYLPFVQIKRDKRYNPRKMLETSMIEKDGKYYDYYIDYDGVKQDNYVELTMSCVTFELFREHYLIKDFEILSGCWFYAIKGIFDKYIDHFMSIKEKSKGAKRAIAKLFLNSLYGKFATTTDSSFKIFFLGEYGNVKCKSVKEKNKKGGYIAVGSAITSYTRRFIITHAQENYDTFVYSDTDSLHLTTREPVNIEIHPTKLSCWKAESYWDIGWFVRAKTYIEHITHADEKELDKPYYNITCAGLPDYCKKLFIKSMGEDIDVDLDKSKGAKKFVSKKRDITDFKVGIEIPGKLKQKRIKGGIVLYEEIFKMKNSC